MDVLHAFFGLTGQPLQGTQAGHKVRSTDQLFKRSPAWAWWLYIWDVADGVWVVRRHRKFSSGSVYETRASKGA